MLFRKSQIFLHKLGEHFLYRTLLSSKSLFVWVQFDLKLLIPSLADIIARSSKLQMGCECGCSQYLLIAREYKRLDYQSTICLCHHRPTQYMQMERASHSRVKGFGKWAEIYLLSVSTGLPKIKSVPEFFFNVAIFEHILHRALDSDSASRDNIALLFT